MIKTYTETRCELEIAKARINWLVDKKTMLYAKCFPSGIKYGTEPSGGSNGNYDPMLEYMHELTAIDPITGMSIEQEIEYQQEKVRKLTVYLDVMAAALSQLDKVEYKLFYEIVYNGAHVTKAVETVAAETGRDVSTIWKYNYPIIKRELKKIRLSSESTVNYGI